MTLELEMTAEDVRAIVGEVADTMLQDHCAVEMGTPAVCGVKTRSYDISLSGEDSVIGIGLIASENCALKLAQHLTGRLDVSMDEPMVDDVMKEWLNIMAGQVKSFCALDHRLGIPQRRSEENDRATSTATHLTLSSMGVNMVVQLFGATLKNQGPRGG